MQAKVVRLCFDAARGIYEARVDVEREGRTFRYPCRIEASESAPREWLEGALTRQALRMAASDRPLGSPAPGRGFLGRPIEVLAQATAPYPETSEIPVRATDPVRPQARLY